MEASFRHGTGVLIGKFLPPHRGHQALVEFARRHCHKLIVLVCTLQREPIPGAFRHVWMQRMFPDLDVRHVTDENPQEPHEHPDFWAIWRSTILRAMGSHTPDLLFASETYGVPLAQVLGAEFVPFDLTRSMRATSGTEVRHDPMKHWDMLPEPVRPYFLRRVRIVGAESTGKSTLTQRLAAHYNTTFAAEYARTWLTLHERFPVATDITAIARGQLASEMALARQANRVFFTDTDTLTTVLWSRELFHSSPEWIESTARTRRYALTLVTHPDVPFEPDPVRYRPHRREAFHQNLLDELQHTPEPIVHVKGDWDTRWNIALNAVDTLIAQKDCPPFDTE